MNPIRKRIKETICNARHFTLTTAMMLTVMSLAVTYVFQKAIEDNELEKGTLMVPSLNVL